jgi:trigger factor
MQITREDLNPCTVKLSISCEEREVAEGFESAFRHLTKKLRLPGFRPGKAPRSMLEPFVVPEELNNEAAETMIRKVYPKALEDQNLEVDRTTMPHIVIEAIDKAEKKFDFSVKVPLRPKVELGEYRGLPVVQPSVDVTEAEIDYEIEELRGKESGHGPVTDRGVAEGDVAVLNIKQEGENSEGKTVVTIAGQNFPELDEGIMGMRVEEIKNLDLHFPDSFPNKELAGKQFKAQVTLNSLSSVTLPPLDDAFAQSLKTESVEDLRNRLREAIGHAKHLMVRSVVHERLVDELLHRSEVAVSDNMWENLANRRLDELAQEQRRENRTLEDYAKDNGMELEEFTKAWNEKAKLEVERALLVQAIFGKENMQIENQEVYREIQAMAEESQVTPTEMLEVLTKNKALDEIHFRAMTRKVGDFLLSVADVTIEPSPEETTPPVEASPA